MDCWSKDQTMDRGHFLVKNIFFKFWAFTKTAVPWLKAQESLQLSFLTANKLHASLVAFLSCFLQYYVGYIGDLWYMLLLP